MESKLDYLKKCEICPHRCGVDRTNNQIGRCKSKNTVKVAKASIHMYEEPCISKGSGSGTVFFSNCNLNCVFCQNYEISQNGLGHEITIKELANIFLKLQSENVNNINLVTPTSYVPQIIEAIKIAKDNGLNIPIVYNTNSYENIETLKLLEGYIDIYLPDLKYSENELGEKYSNVKNYFEVATTAIKEMYRQVGNLKCDKNGIAKKGVIIRHLVLPNHIENSKKVLSWIKNNLPQDVYVSVMNQYFPIYKAKNIKDLNRKITKREMKKIEEFIYSTDLKNGYIQDIEENEIQYVPNWKNVTIL
ncbi:MAG TPA: radical SAM protein [Clostridiales bacterium]|nr:radical SAM protein [Clostridiales bacterium]